MSTPKVITYRGKEYVRVTGASSLADLRMQATALHDLAQQLRPSIASSDAAQELTAIKEALTNMVRANNFLLSESQVLPNNVPGNSERILALAVDAVDSVDTLGERLQKLAARVGTWALKIDEYVRDRESKADQDPGTQVRKQQESKQFGHLW